MKFKTEPPNYEPDDNGLVGVTGDVAAAGVSMVVNNNEESDEESDEKEEEPPAPPATPTPSDF